MKRYRAIMAALDKRFIIYIIGMLTGGAICICFLWVGLAVSAAENEEMEVIESTSISDGRNDDSPEWDNEQSEPDKLEPEGEDEQSEPDEPEPEGEDEQSEPDEPEQEGEDEQSQPGEPEPEGEGEQSQPDEPEPPLLEINPFASGSIVGELADLLQDNVIENDGYTDESWQRYEQAVSTAWAVITNFMSFSNEEVQQVIDELKAAIAGLEYPSSNPSEDGSGQALDPEFIIALCCILGVISGAILGGTFISQWKLGV